MICTCDIHKAKYYRYLELIKSEYTTLLVTVNRIIHANCVWKMKMSVKHGLGGLSSEGQSVERNSVHPLKLLIGVDIGILRR